MGFEGGRTKKRRTRGTPPHKRGERGRAREGGRGNGSEAKEEREEKRAPPLSFSAASSGALAGHVIRNALEPSLLYCVHFFRCARVLSNKYQPM